MLTAAAGVQITTPRIVTAAVLLVVSTSLIICSGFVLFAIVGEVNRKLPEQEHVSYLGWHAEKYTKILGEYRRLYPEGLLAAYLKTSLFLAFTLLLACAFAFGFFGQ